MRKISIILIALVFFTSCSKPGDCIESTGDIITKDFSTTPFKKIIVNKGIALVISQGTEFKVVVETGENLMDGIEVKFENNTLVLRDNASCNWVRDYGHTTVYVETPYLDELDIDSKTERDISSNGVLTHSIIRLIAIDLQEGAGTNDFYFQVNNSQTVIENNNVSRFYISGQTNQLILGFYDGNGRLEAENLVAKNINVFHRGSNDLIVQPTESIKGKMVSTGDVILKNVPPIIEVEQLYQGRLIYP